MIHISNQHGFGTDSPVTDNLADYAVRINNGLPDIGAIVAAPVDQNHVAKGVQIDRQYFCDQNVIPNFFGGIQQGAQPGVFRLEGGHAQHACFQRKFFLPEATILVNQVIA